jgi:hypothetical protein
MSCRNLAQERKFIVMLGRLQEYFYNFVQLRKKRDMQYSMSFKASNCQSQRSILIHPRLISGLQKQSQCHQMLAILR